MITIHNRQRKIAVDTTRLRALIQNILNILDYTDFDIGLLITNNKNIREYNRTYRHKDKPTDILSFSYHPTLKAGKRIRVDTPEDRNLGDLIISLEYIKKQSDEAHIKLEERLTILLVHGICHLLGYDHETDAQYRSMKKQESSILKQLEQTYLLNPSNYL